MNFVAVDFETANSRPSSACALGIAVVKDGEMVENRSWLIRPKHNYFSRFNTRIHGISQEDVASEPTFGELWDLFRPLLEGQLIIAHNAAFDLGVLKGTLDSHGIEYPRLDYMCTVRIARKSWPALDSHRLNHIAEHLGIEFRHHRADEDALVCAEIAREACRLAKANCLRGLAKQLGVATGKLHPV